MKVNNSLEKWAVVITAQTNGFNLDSDLNYLYLPCQGFKNLNTIFLPIKI